MPFSARQQERSRLTDEADRLLRVMDKRLGEGPYLAGADYFVADIA